MKFSLILGTLGRTEQVDRFISSLIAQNYRSWELIVVDQNTDEHLAPILAKYAPLSRNILRVRSEKGLSRARNRGLKYSTGNVIGFPDDDCWYGEELLDKVRAWFEEHPTVDGLSILSSDTQGRHSGCHWDRRGGTITKANVWRRAISSSIFLRRSAVESVGDFDVDVGLGSGTVWGAGEETDYLLRALQIGFRLEYFPSLTVYHERPLLGDGAFTKGYSYGLGFGHIQRKHGYSFPVVFYYWLRPAAGALIAIAKRETAEAMLRWGILKGRVVGWLH